MLLPSVRPSRVKGSLAVAHGRLGRGERPQSLAKELPWHYLGLTYAVFRVIPLILLVHLALREPALWTLVAAAAVWTLVESWHSIRYRYR